MTAPTSEGTKQRAKNAVNSLEANTDSKAYRGSTRKRDHSAVLGPA